MWRVRRNEAGSTLVELLIVIVILGVLASIAVPIYLAQRNKAKDSSIQTNVRNVKIVAHGYVAGDLNTTWQASHALTNGTLSTWATTYVSCAIEENIKLGGATGTNADGYRNPYSGKTLIVNQAALPTGTSVQPAIYITQPSSTTYRYASFPTNSTTKADLAGSVVVCWNTTTKNIEIFSVDRNGKKSATCAYVAL
jgi:prepilin-type N-terminal cleavage/methylation domain-containing protein